MSFVKKKYIKLDTHIVRFDAQQMMQGSKVLQLKKTTMLTRDWKL